MAGRRLAVLTLTEAERSELTALAARRQRSPYPTPCPRATPDRHRARAAAMGAARHEGLTDRHDAGPVRDHGIAMGEDAHMQDPAATANWRKRNVTENITCSTIVRTPPCPSARATHPDRASIPATVRSTE